MANVMGAAPMGSADHDFSKSPATSSWVDRGQTHNLAQGETMTSIANQYGVPLDELKKANPHITNPDSFPVGTQLKIPTQHVDLPEDQIHANPPGPYMPDSL